MSQIQFTWKTQKGLGILVIFLGWAVSFQIIPTIHSLSILNVGTQPNAWMIYLGVIVGISIITAALMATIFEKLYDPADSNKTIINIHTIVLVGLFTFIVGWALGVPVLTSFETILSLEAPLAISGWIAYLIAEASSIVALSIIWLISERFPNH